MAYFMLAVSTFEHLEKCLEMNLAGFTGSSNGFWAFVDVEEGDYVSFIHGARVYNLYRVEKKVAIRNPDEVGPWGPIKLPSGRTYSFPFRLILKPVRQLSESMIRPEFSYIAENLLLRGGYRKTHFQADEVTLYNVSGMGKPAKVTTVLTPGNWEEFTPRIAFSKKLTNPPLVFPMREVILQSLVRKAIEGKFLGHILDEFGLNRIIAFEVLGEKALPSGHVDILIKPRHPVGENPKIPVEVKLGKAGRTDVEQVERYMRELGPEAVGGVLIARSFKSNVRGENILLLRYGFEGLNDEETYTYRELLERLYLEGL